jgi:predicted HTH transcriptional regulator
MKTDSNNKKVKNTKMSKNSIKCYHEITSEGLIETEDKIALRLIEEHQPVTSRTLMYLMQKERGNITRVLYDLVKADKLKIAFSDKCQVTGRTVSYYALPNWCNDTKAA